MLNRSLPPNTSLPDHIDLPACDKVTLAGNIPLIVVSAGTQELVRIECIFAAGSALSESRLTATACNDLIDEGSNTTSAADIAERLDFYGAFLQTECGPEWASVCLFSLNKFVASTLPVLEEILTEPAFPEHEISLYSLQSKQRLQVALNKVDVLARRQFMASLYGEQSSMGRMTFPSDYDTLDRSALQSFHQRNYLGGLRAVVVSGKPDEHVISTVKAMIEKHAFSNACETLNGLAIPAPENRLVEKADAIQSAIRIGRRLFGRNHPDFAAFSVLNTILGGYFGSRLMSNIREDKGYTYGIGSGVVPQCDDGYFFIATEVGVDVRDAAVREIYAEMKRLREELVPQAELDLVVNYMTGAFQRSLDGPFALADRYKMIEINNLDINYLTEYLNRLRSVTAEKIQTLANHYLCEEALTCVIAGK